MKILIVCPKIDNAGGKILLAKGFNQYTDHECHCAVGRKQWQQFETEWLLDDPETLAFAAEADVFMYFAHDWTETPALQKFLKGKKVLYKGPSHFRGRSYTPKDYIDSGATLLSYQETARVYANQIWVPKYVPDYEFIVRNWEGELVVGQSPSSFERKGTSNLSRAMEQVPAKLRIINRRWHRDCMELKERCHIGVDGLVEGYGGMSGYEFTSMGIPTFCYLEESNRQALKAWGDGKQPFLNVKTARDLHAGLATLMSDRKRLQAIAEATRAWMIKYHNPKRVLARYEELIEATGRFRYEL